MESTMPRTLLSLYIVSRMQIELVTDYVSTNVFVIYLGSNPISWSSEKQHGVARSSTEAEYRTVTNTVSELIWLYSLLQELGIRLSLQPMIYCDNVGATYLFTSLVFHPRMKYIALDNHFIRNLVQAGALRISHVSTHDQLGTLSPNRCLVTNSNKHVPRLE